MTTVIYGAEIDLDIQSLKDKLETTINVEERLKLERQISILDDALVLYRLTPRDYQTEYKGVE